MTAAQEQPEMALPVEPDPGPSQLFFAKLGMGDSQVGAGLAALLLATALLYSRSLSHEFVLDDLDWIGNPYVKSWSRPCRARRKR